MILSDNLTNIEKCDYLEQNMPDFSMVILMIFIQYFQFTQKPSGLVDQVHELVDQRN